METPQQTVAANLAHALLAGSWRRAALLRRARQACRPLGVALNRVVRQVRKQFGEQVPDFDTLNAFLNSCDDLQELDAHRMYWIPATMMPRWPVPVLATIAQLADWLGVPVPQLEWLADAKGLTTEQKEPRLRHYQYKWVPRRRGRPRLLEMPKAHLKAIQRRILHEILDRIPPHDAAHGFRAGRSILSYGKPHTGKSIVLRFDLCDFFASISAARVQAIFRTAGYPETVAHLLAGLCTTRTPEEILETHVVPPRWLLRHLPQGAPTSPALANLAAYRLDIRLQALAQSLNAAYTRYADDLAFSGAEDLTRAARRMQVVVAVIAAEEGFELQFRKSRFMRRSVRQHLAGVVLNDKPNVPRDKFDELKAILFNCGRSGPSTQNRGEHADFRAHLLGRIAHVALLNSRRGARLRLLFERIDWEK